MTVEHKRRVRQLVGYLRSLDGQPGYGAEAEFVGPCGWTTGLHDRGDSITLLRRHLLLCVECRDST